MCLFISEELENIFGLVSYIERLQQRQDDMALLAEGGDISIRVL